MQETVHDMKSNPILHCIDTETAAIPSSQSDSTTINRETLPLLISSEDATSPASNQDDTNSILPDATPRADVIAPIVTTNLMDPSEPNLDPATVIASFEVTNVPDPSEPDPSEPNPSELNPSELNPSELNPSEPETVSLPSAEPSRPLVDAFATNNSAPGNTSTTPPVLLEAAVGPDHSPEHDDVPLNSSTTGDSIVSDAQPSARNPVGKNRKRRDRLRKLNAEEHKQFFADFTRLLSRFRSAASLLKRAPKDLLASSRIARVVKQFDRYYVPLIIQLFGSMEEFSRILSLSNIGRESLEAVASTGELDDVICEELERFAPDIIQQWRAKEQEHHDQVSPVILTTVTDSERRYRMLNDVTLRETPGRAQRRALTRLTRHTNSRLPKILRESPNFETAVKQSVLAQGGGFNIVQWYNRNWVNSILTSSEVEPTVKQYFNKAKKIKGTYLKAIYERSFEKERTSARMEHLQQIAKEFGDQTFPAERWREIVKDARWVGLPDAAFLADLWYRRRCTAAYWRRGAMTIDGVAVAGPSKLSVAKKTIVEKALGQWPDSDIQPTPTTQEAFRCFLEDDQYPIGEAFETTIPGTANGVAIETTHKYQGRRVPLRIVLAYLAAQAVKHGLLRKGLAVYNLQFGVWIDACTSLGHPVLVNLGFLVRDPVYYTSSQKQWVDAHRHYPLSIAFSHECIDSVTQEMTVLGKDLLEVESITHGGKTFNFNFSVLTGDNSAVSKMIGNSCGGLLRCPHCTADFANSEDLWSYAHLKTCKLKTLSAVSDMIKDATSGVVRQCGIFSACATEEQRQELMRRIKNCKLAVDPLHNIKGHLKNIIACMRKWSCWDDAIFVKLLGDVIQRKAPSDLDGAHMRLLAELHKEVIMPALDDCPPETRAKVERLFEGWSEVLAFYVFLPHE